MKGVTIESKQLHIWTFNNPIRGISDQIEFLLDSVSENGYKASVSRRPSVQGLNIIIENLDESTLAVVAKFSRDTGKRLAVVVTEHMDFKDGKILFHGAPLESPSEYMHPVSKQIRLIHLFLARPYVRYLLKLGDLPSLEGVDRMFPSIPILTLPFPYIKAANRAARGGGEPQYDFVFAGNLTRYRERVLAMFSGRFSLYVVKRALSRRQRDAAYSRARVVLNIPQDPDWVWVSSMRVLAAWRCGRPVINVGNAASGEVAPFCCNVPDVEGGEALLRVVVGRYREEAARQMQQYHLFCGRTEAPAFPHAALWAWSVVEKNA